MKIIDIARVCHEANRALQIIQGDPNPSMGWMLAEAWQRESAVESVKAAIEGKDAEQLHQAWVDVKVADGWVHGDVKDATAKTHPCLVPYDELDSGQKLKDHVFSAIVTTMTGDPSFIGE